MTYRYYITRTTVDTFIAVSKCSGKAEAHWAGTFYKGAISSAHSTNGERRQTMHRYPCDITVEKGKA